MISDEQLKAAVQATRKTLGMKQEDFADHIGMSYPMVQHFEGGKQRPQTRTLAVLSRVAREAGLEEEARLFYEALEESLGQEVLVMLRGTEVIPSTDSGKNHYNPVKRTGGTDTIEGTEIQATVQEHSEEWRHLQAIWRSGNRDELITVRTILRSIGGQLAAEGNVEHKGPTLSPDAERARLEAKVGETTAGAADAARRMQQQQKDDSKAPEGTPGSGPRTRRGKKPATG